MSDAVAAQMMSFIEDVFPYCRSITGDGVRDTFQRLGRELPIEVSEVPTGTRVFDWTVPKEWNIRGGFLDDPAGDRVLDFADNNLHVLNYSTPVDQRLDLQQLEQRLHSLPEQPDLIPYRTSYYDEQWGFCLAHRRREGLQDGSYHAVIDSELRDGSLTLAELAVPGQTREEILVYSHSCHPSLANDNLSGLAVTVWWAKWLLENGGNHHSYRFVWGPGTIGSITWLAKNQTELSRIRHGLVVVLVGRPGTFHYKKSRRENAAVDEVSKYVLGQSASGVRVRDFEPYGYDERQFCSPGINLSVGRLSRTPNGEYPEYHTSADNLSLIDPGALQEALEQCLRIGSTLDSNLNYINLLPNCEPQLGRRGLFRKTGGDAPPRTDHAMLWLLNYSDGTKSVLDIAQKSGIDYEIIAGAAQRLQSAGLIEAVRDET